jgi:hypothetical protein
MLGKISSMFAKKPPQKGGPVRFEVPTSVAPLRRQHGNDNKHTFSKVFRWRLPDGQTQEAQSVEITGTFTKWQRVALQHDGVLDSWHTTIHHIPSNRTHHYMLFVDGQPTLDKTCDGLAVPHGFEEEQHAMQTDKGPRVLMLFSMTK